LLEALGADSDFREAVIGDLAEEFATRAMWDGEAEARRWYRRECLRVAPYLIRDWWRRLSGRNVVYLGGVVAASSVAMLILERVLKLITWIALREELARSPTLWIVWAGLMLLWTLVDGTLAGYVAGRLGRRAPLASALALALIWGVAMILIQSASVPWWFRATNTVVIMTGMLGGGVLASLARPEPVEGRDRSEPLGS
jgi:hypothetical protein